MKREPTSVLSIQIELLKLLREAPPLGADEAEIAVRAVLSKGARLDLPITPQGRTALQYVAANANGRTGWVAALAACGADLDKTDPGGHSPLMLAARDRHEGCQIALLEAGAAPDPCALFEASHLSVVRAMAAKGCDLDSRDEEGRNALFLAWPSLDISEFLIRGGADVNAVANDGSRPVDAILDLAGIDVLDACAALRLFIACGADLMADGKYGVRPIDRALRLPKLQPIAHSYLARIMAIEAVDESNVAQGPRP